MGMFQRGPRCEAMVFEDEDVSEARVAPQVDNPITVGQQDILYTLERQGGQGLFMPRRFDHDFMSTDAIHFIIDPFAFSVQFSFYSESRELIGDDAKGPTRRVGRGSVVSERKDFRRGSILVAFTEGAESADRPSFLRSKIRGSPTPLGGNDHPSSMDRVFSQLGHRGFIFGRKWGVKRGSFF